MFASFVLAIKTIFMYIVFKSQIKLLMLLLIALSCSCERDIDVLPALEKNVYILFSPGGIGDSGYNDLILRGALQAQKENDFRLHVLSPNSVEEAEKMYSAWLQSEDDENPPTLFILAASEYEDIPAKYSSSEIGENKKVVLFETRTSQSEISTFSISMYGACYLSGAIAAIFGEQAAIICGNKNDKAVNVAVDGFYAGFMEAGGSEIIRENLSDTWEGYAMPELAYTRTAELSKQYSFIFPLAGGSNLGIFRYTREYSKGLYTAGMDVEQSRLSSQITFSVVKHIDKLLKEYVGFWLNDVALPDSAVYGLESGYIDVVLSSNYEDACCNRFNNYRNRAVMKEKEYEENR